MKQFRLIIASTIVLSAAFFANQASAAQVCMNGKAGYVSKVRLLDGVKIPGRKTAETSYASLWTTKCITVSPNNNPRNLSEITVNMVISGKEEIGNHEPNHLCPKLKWSDIQAGKKIVYRARGAIWNPTCTR